MSVSEKAGSALVLFTRHFQVYRVIVEAKA